MLKGSIHACVGEAGLGDVDFVCTEVVRSNMLETWSFDLLSMEQWAALRLSEKLHAYREEAAAQATSRNDKRLRAAALALAVERGLIESAGDVDVKTGLDEKMALLRAVAQGYPDDVGLLLHAKCDIDARDVRGYTALACSVVYGNEEMARVLMKGGAQIDVINKRGESILYLCCRHGRSRLMCEILSKFCSDGCESEAVRQLLSVNLGWSLIAAAMARREAQVVMVCQILQMRLLLSLAVVLLCL